MPPSKLHSKVKQSAKPAATTLVKAETATMAPPAAILAAPAAPPPAAPAPATVPDALKAPDAVATYQALYDALGRAYWDASDLHSKDTVQGARDAVYDIITGLNTVKLQANTAAYLALMPKVVLANKTLEQIKDDIGNITKNITTAASVITAITRVLSIAAMF